MTKENDVKIFMTGGTGFIGPRKMIGSADALDRFMAWRAPDER